MIKTLALALFLLAGCTFRVSADADTTPAPRSLPAAECPHRTHQVFDAAGHVTNVDNTPAEDASICAYLAYLAEHADTGEAGAAP